MVNYLYYATVLLGSAIFCVSLVVLLKKPFFNLSKSVVRQLDIILHPSIDEKEKDKRILQNLSKVLSDLSVVILLFILAVLIGIAPVYVFSRIYPDYTLELNSIYFYSSMILGSFVLFFFKNKSDYSYWSKLLHHIILDNYNIGKYLFRKEIKKKNPDKDSNFVIVTGLARAGTTALTNLLYEPEAFHSISYANMPFLLAPNFWKKIYNPKSSKQRERAHGDKVFFSENSIEALEEYFFKAFLDDTFIEGNSLQIHAIDREIFEKYLTYQTLFKDNNTRHTTYLAKNNNFILRYESLRTLNKDFKTVLVFRNPLDHAKSLLAQHLNFAKKQKEDGFVARYMNWLGHYEFGLNHKFFDLGNEKIWQKFEADSLNYWIAIWINYYSYTLRFLNDSNLYLVHYEDLANQPRELKQGLAQRLGVELNNAPQEKFKRKKTIVENLETFNGSLFSHAEEIYHVLIKNKININDAGKNATPHFHETHINPEIEK